jgi:hypothetical protein
MQGENEGKGQKSDGRGRFGVKSVGESLGHKPTVRKALTVATKTKELVRQLANAALSG